MLHADLQSQWQACGVPAGTAVQLRDASLPVLTFHGHPDALQQSYNVQKYSLEASNSPALANNRIDSRLAVLHDITRCCHHTQRKIC